MATICVNTFLTDNAESIAYLDTKFVSPNEYVAVGGYEGKAIVTKFNKNGTVIWSNQYTVAGRSFSFSRVELVNGSDSVIVYAPYLIAGTSGSPSARIKYLTVKINGSGAVQATRTFSTSKSRIARGMTRIGSSNDYYIGGWYHETGSTDDIELYRFNQNLNLQKTVRLRAAGDDQISCIASDNNGVIIGGQSGARSFMAKIDSQLNSHDGIAIPGITEIKAILPVSSTGIQAAQSVNPLALAPPSDQIYFAGVSSTELIVGVISGFPVSASTVQVRKFAIANRSTPIELIEGNNAIYLLHRGLNASETIVIKLSLSLQEIWRKRVDVGAGSRFSKGETNGNELLLAGLTSNIGGLISLSDLELDTCKTINLAAGSYTNATLNILDHSMSVNTLSNTQENDTVVRNSLGLNTVFHCGEPIEKEPFTQSSHVYLQAAGSDGSDGSASGIHLRWIFKNRLGETHLPKGNSASGTANFNKSNDFVKIFRAPYEKSAVRVDLNSIPNVVDNNNRLWVYNTSGRTFYVNFANQFVYDQVRQSVNPSINPGAFIAQYGDNIIEIENRDEFFFGAEVEVSGASASSILRTELLSTENIDDVDKNISARKTFNGLQVRDTYQEAENLKSIRFRASNCTVSAVSIDLYSEMVEVANANQSWTELGQFALTTNKSEAYTALEPSAGVVNGQWPRYNDNAFVNVANYQDKWDGAQDEGDRNVKQVIDKYIELSNVNGNPTALETITFESDSEDTETDSLEISNLEFLRIASLDYHLARMLGLGYLDLSGEAKSGKYFYLAEYVSDGDLGDGSGDRVTEHAYLTLPTDVNDQRLPMSVDLDEPFLGIKTNESNEEAVVLTDENGYTQDGKTRYITLFSEALPEYDDLSFYATIQEYNISSETVPVYVGIEYKLDSNSDWRKPELPNTADYQNAVPAGQTPHNETIPLSIPDPEQPLFVHREKENGLHIYSSYGINWFGRSARSAVEWEIATLFQRTVNLLPPSNVNPLLIKKESPLLLTSAEEQAMYNAITADDKTLARITFDYHTLQDMVTYKITPDDMGSFTDPLNPNAIYPDSDEIFADKAEVYFRSEIPKNVRGKAKSIVDDPSNEVLAIIRTESYHLASTGEDIVPILPAGEMANYTGGVFILEEEEYVIHTVLASAIPGEGPVFKVYKKEISDAIQSSAIPNPGADLETPQINADGLFMAVENMLNPVSWGTPNPGTFKVQLGDNWPVHREVITQEGPDDEPEQVLEKTRGIWSGALVEEQQEAVDVDSSGNEILGFAGLYKITLNGTSLDHHPQYNAAGNSNSVDWFGGIVRIHRTNDPNGPRKALQVVKLAQVGTANDLEIYAYDTAFEDVANPPTDVVQTGTNVEVNFYPGYITYLYADTSLGLNEDNTLPETGEGVKYSVFGLRSTDDDSSFVSKISVPKMMFAEEVIEPKVPEEAEGALYATRPDSFGKSSYTFTNQFEHAPYGILYYRLDENTVLNALYKPGTIATIKAALKGFENDEFFANRWTNLLGFDYTYESNDPVNTDGEFGIYPPTVDGYQFPNPDREDLFAAEETPGSLNPGAIADRIKTAVHDAFVPLTQVPVLYQYISDDSSYEPVDRPQVIRDRNGSLLKPSHPDFDVAPMAKIVGANKVKFTDFGLDGTSDNVYFYSTREMGNSMQLGDFSPILGPVKLVNTKAPTAPELKRVLSVTANENLGILPGISFEINAYPDVQKIRKVNLYRTMNAEDTLSVRSMDLVKTVDIIPDPANPQNSWTIKDEFDDLGFVPYGDPLFYRLTVAREVEFEDKNGDIVLDYAPSQSSKIIVSNVIEGTSPEAPVSIYSADPVNASFELHNVVLSWDKVTHNGKYNVFKLNRQGNWIKIHELTSNEEQILLPLADTSIDDPVLLTQDGEGNKIYHQFKVDVENTAGMMNLKSNIIAVPSE
ncbi:MAG: hypothetical protein AAFQ94_08010 [Bacteroidota bacterium]